MKPGVANTLIYGIEARLKEINSLPHKSVQGHLREISEAIEFCESLGANLVWHRKQVDRFKQRAAEHGPDPAA